MKVQLQKPDFEWLLNGVTNTDQVGVLWDRLIQRCPPIAESVANANQNISAVAEINIEGSFFGIPKSTDICIAYSLKNGEKLARNKTVSLAYTGEFDPRQTEKNIASSSALIVLLTAESLKQVELVFSLVVAKYYYEHPSLVILVHDAESCFFPGYDEQPESVKEFFSEKAVTFLSCYPEDGTSEIVNKFDDEMGALENILENYKENPTEALFQFLERNSSRKKVSVSEIRQKMFGLMSVEQLNEFEKLADKNRDGVLDSEELEQALAMLKENQRMKDQAEHSETAAEDLTTRLFLSHKRSSGQGVAGRLYEGLKSDYAIFIDSEAKFKIHNLGLIVQNTDVLVFILSQGILQSKWCLEELKSAVANKKRVIIVRELTFKLPDVLPEEWSEVEPIIRNSPELVWLAEYNSCCVRELRAFIGSPDERYRAAEKFFQTEYGQEIFSSIQTKFQTENILDLNRTIALPTEIQVDAVLDILLRTIPQEKITTLHVKPSSNVIYEALFLKLRNVQDLTVCGPSVTENAFEEFVIHCPVLRRMTLEYLEVTTYMVERLAQAQELRHLDLERAAGVNDETIAQLVGSSLETLLVPVASVTHEVFNHLAKLPKLKDVSLPFLLQTHQAAQNYVAAHPAVKVTMVPLLCDFNVWGSWCTGIITGFALDGKTMVHSYCQGGGSWPQEPSSIEAFGSHQQEYQTLGTITHGFGDCPLCEYLHPLLGQALFDGKPSCYFVDQGVFDTPEGKTSMDNLLANAAKGYLVLPSGKVLEGPVAVKQETYGKALLQKIDPKTITAVYANAIEACALEFWLESLPNIKTLHTQGWNKQSEALSRVIQALPSSLEHMKITGEIHPMVATQLASKLTSLQSLCITEERTQAGLLAYFGVPNKLQSLTVRNCFGVTTAVLQQIAESSKELASLDITMNPRLGPDSIPVLMKSFPNLKKLTVDATLFKSPQFQEFRDARPHVTIDEHAYLRDVFIQSQNSWIPAIQVSDATDPDSVATYHPFGSTQFAESQFGPDQISPVLTHTTNYGAVTYPCPWKSHACHGCRVINALCGNITFGTFSNPFSYASSWLHSDGTAFWQFYAPKGADNLITFTNLSDGPVQELHVVQALSRDSPDKKYVVRFVNTAETKIRNCIESYLPLTGLEIIRHSQLSQDFFKVLASNLPDITRLALSYCDQSNKQGWSHLAQLTELQHLHIPGNSLTDEELEFILNFSKLTELDISANEATDKFIELLAKKLPNLTSLNLRGLQITEKSIQHLAQNCHQILSLDISACNLPASVCKLLSEGFPQLQQVKIPTSFSHTDHLKNLKSNRPSLVVVEGTDAVDCLQPSGWKPGVVVGETATAQLVHEYCGGSASPQWFEKGTSLAPFLTHKDAYAKQDEMHSYRSCHCCDVLHAACRDLRFEGNQNIALKGEWFFQTEQGVGQLGNICDAVKAAGGMLDSAYPTLSAGIKPVTLLRLVLETIPMSVTTMICTTMSTEDLSYLLIHAPNLKHLSLHGVFGDEHAKIVPQKKPHLRSLSLMLCNITDDGLKTISSKVKDLTSFSIRLCKNISDKGVAQILQANQKIEKIELDFQHQLTFRTVLLVSKLPRLVSVTASYDVLRQKSVGNAVGKLQVARPTVKFTRSPFLVDGPDGTLGFVVGFKEPNGPFEVENQFKIHNFSNDEEDTANWMYESQLSKLSLKTYQQHPQYAPECSICRSLFVAGKQILFNAY